MKAKTETVPSTPVWICGLCGHPVEIPTGKYAIADHVIDAHLAEWLAQPRFTKPAATKPVTG